jgi:prepilin-type N-terminal cleavage/methylation domain-containing protein
VSGKDIRNIKSLSDHFCDAVILRKSSSRPGIIFQAQQDRRNIMKSQQAGFTLVEIAIVLVIIGLLLGGILKGQELINSAKVKNLANDFRTIPTYIYGYQDKFRALPGDDCLAATHVGAPAVDQVAPCPAPFGNGVINNNWDTVNPADESALFWQHVRLANLAAGPTATNDLAYYPTNAEGGRIGISSATPGLTYITGMTGTYQICSKGILGKFAKQLDVQTDDGNTTTGSMRAVPDASPLPTAAVAISAAQESNPYTVCVTF